MNTFKNQAGVGLIEVLVTALILATALMAVAALQTRSLQYNGSAYLRSQANIIAYDVLDQMRTLSASEWDDGAVVEPDINALVATLPGGAGDVACEARVCTVSITWNEPVADVENEYVSEQTTFSYTSRI